MKCWVVVAALAAFAGACAPMQEIERVPDVDPKMAEAFASTKSIVYERAIVRGERGDSTVTVQAGLACVPHGQAHARSGQYAATDQEYENAFQEEFARAGYRIARTVGSGDLFTDKKDIAADFRIAGVVTRPKMNVCFPLAGFGNFSTGTGEASLTVEWQVYPPLARVPPVADLDVKADGQSPVRLNTCIVVHREAADLEPWPTVSHEVFSGGSSGQTCDDCRPTVRHQGRDDEKSTNLHPPNGVFSCLGLPALHAQVSGLAAKW